MIPLERLKIIRKLAREAARETLKILRREAWRMSLSEEERKVRFGSKSEGETHV